MSDFYLEQLLTIGISGAFAVIGWLMFSTGKLRYILAPELIIWVPLAATILFVLTVTRMVLLWRATRPGHEHGPSCNHAHDHGDDGHGHEHGSIYWRVIILMFPLVLFLLGLPNEGFSNTRREAMLGADTDLGTGSLREVAEKAGGEVSMTFADLAAAAADADARSGLEGRVARLKGQLRRVSDKECTLYFMKMNCCAADMIPLKARILADSSLASFADHQWVEVSGKLQFAEVPGKGQFIPVIRTSTKAIKKSTPE
ncbi:MAG: DUF1980 domain-containing protein [Gemmataceae bacterium]